MKQKTNMDEQGKHNDVKVTTYRNGEKRIILMPESEAMALESKGFGLFLSTVHVLAIVRNPAGKVVAKHDKQIRGIGPHTLAVLLKLMSVPGRYLQPYELGRMEPEIESHHVGDCVIAHVARLRKHLFRETARNARFLLTTSPFAVVFSRYISFCLVERADKNTEDD